MGSALAAGGLLTGCVTSRFLERETYREDVSSILLSEDGRSFVVIGDRYHYVFAAPTAILNTLHSSFHGVVEAELWDFEVDNENRVSGNYRLWVIPGASEFDQRSASMAGYTRNDRGRYEYIGTLTGTRYDSGGIQPGERQRLNRSYSVKISVEPPNGEKAAKALLTPVTLAADGVLILGTVLLIVVAAYLQTEFNRIQAQAVADESP